MEQKITTPITKGVIITLVLVAITMATTFLSTSYNGAYRWLGYIFFVAGIIYSVWVYGKQIDHQSTFGNYFAHGFKTSAVVTCFMIVFLVIFMSVFPEFKERAIEESRKGMEGRNMPDDKIEQAMEFTKRFFMVLLIAGTLFVYLFIGCIAALIGAAITKKNPVSFSHDINQTGG